MKRPANMLDVDAAALASVRGLANVQRHSSKHDAIEARRMLRETATFLARMIVQRRADAADIQVFREASAALKCDA